MKPFSYLFLLCLLLGCAAPLRAQNLVPNPSFEEFTTCPDYWSQTERATGWSAYRNSPDYFNACEPTGYWSVPHNIVGHQNAATGNAYCGMITWTQPTMGREHVGAQLIAPLVVGVPVNISFRMVSALSDFIGYAASGFGVLFTMEPYYITEPLPLPDHAALHVDSTVTDTVNWLFVSGTYIPDSAYRYIVLGGMFADSLIELDTINPDVLGGDAYVYVDDICVTYDSIPCDFSLALVTATSETFGVFPNPSYGNSFISIFGSTGESRVAALTDASGRFVRSIPVPTGASRIPLPLADLPSGIYYLTLKTTAMGGKTIKLVHINP